jgi:hypothetical protein
LDFGEDQGLRRSALGLYEGHRLDLWIRHEELTLISLALFQSTLYRMEKYRWNGWRYISFDRYGGITSNNQRSGNWAHSNMVFNFLFDWSSFFFFSFSFSTLERKSSLKSSPIPPRDYFPASNTRPRALIFLSSSRILLLLLPCS